MVNFIYLALTIIAIGIIVTYIAQKEPTYNLNLFIVSSLASLSTLLFYNYFLKFILE